MLDGKKGFAKTVWTYIGLDSVKIKSQKQEAPKARVYP